MANVSCRRSMVKCRHTRRVGTFVCSACFGASLEPASSRQVMLRGGVSGWQRLPRLSSTLEQLSVAGSLAFSPSLSVEGLHKVIATQCWSDTVWFALLGLHMVTCIVGRSKVCEYSRVWVWSATYIGWGGARLQAERCITALCHPVPCASCNCSLHTQ